MAQGCRPVGDPYIVTQADGNLIMELGGRPPLARLRELAEALPVREQELLAQGAHLGIVIDEYQTEPGQGDFLVRGIAGADPESGAIAVGGELEVGQTVQFHIRDARSADEDLRRTLVREAAALGGRPVAGALLFTCTGRGTRMFARTGPRHRAPGRRRWARSRWPGSSATGNSGRSAGRTSCTPSPRRSPFSRKPSSRNESETGPE